jgi:hypothetical protein
MCPPWLPHHTESISKDIEVIQLPARIYQSVLQLDEHMAAALMTWGSLDQARAGLLCCTAYFASQLFNSMLFELPIEARLKTYRLWKQGAVAGSPFCQFYLSRRIDGYTDAAPPPGMSAEEYDEETKFWTLTFLARTVQPSSKARFVFPSFLEWVRTEKKHAWPLTRWTEPMWKALIACQVSMAKLQGWVDEAALADGMKQAKLLAKVLNRRIADAKKGTCSRPILSLVSSRYLLLVLRARGQRC